MKNKIFKNLSIFALSITLGISLNSASVSASWELIESPLGNTLEVKSEYPGAMRMSDFWGTEFITCKYSNITVKGKMDSWDFQFLPYMNCETINLSDLEIEKIPPETFVYRKNLKKFIFPKNLKTITKFNFINCPKLEEVILPNNLETIEDNVFINCGNLKLNIPENVKTSKKLQEKCEKNSKSLFSYFLTFFS